MITINSEYAQVIKQAMNGGGTALPFSAPYIYVVNGQQALRKEGGVAAYGGWATNTDDLIAVLQERGVEPPSYLEQAQLVSHDGKALSVYVSRKLLAAPIGYRQSWVTDGGSRYPGYIEGGRRHVQMLVYLADVTPAKQYEPWGIAVLTAKDFQAKNLLDCFAAWDKITVEARRKYAPGVPAYFFYAAVGTFSKEPEFERVGSKVSSSYITPIRVFRPPTIDEACLNRLYVGESVAACMVDALVQAREWLNAWKERGVDMLGTPEQPPAPASYEDEEPAYDSMPF